MIILYKIRYILVHLPALRHALRIPVFLNVFSPNFAGRNVGEDESDLEFIYNYNIKADVLPEQQIVHFRTHCCLCTNLGTILRLFGKINQKNN